MEVHIYVVKFIRMTMSIIFKLVLHSILHLL